MGQVTIILLLATTIGFASSPSNGESTMGKGTKIFP
jgi:hypothetical protein